ncbi:DUF4194 domain-containing protein [Pseudoclavibacter caeni]|uniref:DUF4194 domain-containing protein n=1 Tax=Pseudoclavibacter caeni TaxID=908846 RepID=A0A7C8FS24_9MICO|nr:DUF4194 domain-containing protein [Pseudoclavibacter caeni]KAB1631356.1 DUF4194 domain-containing protein [Pseudoclavibacter caeni]NYJ96755.1 hypothetical protein [Pseudoclavibacter caeni]
MSDETLQGPADARPAEALAEGAENTATPSGLWPGDTGTLAPDSRRALVTLLAGPYLSAANRRNQWLALLADERAIRSRLSDLFVELVIDHDAEVAFVRQVRSDELEVPTVLRSTRLNLIDTLMVLVLRQLLLTSSERRVIVDADEVFEQLEVYRGDTDERVWRSRTNASWGRMLNRLRVLHDVGEGRAEISPVIRYLVDDDRVRALTEQYRELAHAGGLAEADTDADGDADADTVEA